MSIIEFIVMIVVLGIFKLDSMDIDKYYAGFPFITLTAMAFVFSIVICEPFVDKISFSDNIVITVSRIVEWSIIGAAGIFRIIRSSIQKYTSGLDRLLHKINSNKELKMLVESYDKKFITGDSDGKLSVTEEY